MAEGLVAVPVETLQGLSVAQVALHGKRQPVLCSSQAQYYARVGLAADRLGYARRLPVFCSCAVNAFKDVAFFDLPESSDE